MTAGEALAQRIVAALEAMRSLNGRFEGPAVQAASPYATVEAASETDWGHKSGAGREVRLTVTLRDEGERPTRLRRLMAEAEPLCTGIDAAAEGWRIVSLVFLRSRLVPEADRRWAAVLEFRARMLSE